METPSRHSFDLDGSTVVFPIPSYIKGDNYCRVDVDESIILNRTKYDIVNNSIVFVDAADVPAGSVLDVYIVQSEEAIGQLGVVSSLDVIAQNIDAIYTLGENIEAVEALGDAADSIVIVAPYVPYIGQVAPYASYLPPVSDDIDSVVTIAPYMDEVVTVANDIESVVIDADSIDSIVICANDLSGQDYSYDLGSINIEADGPSNPDGDITTVAQNIANIQDVASIIDYVVNASTYANLAVDSADAAAISEDNAAVSETNAAASELAAAASESAAASSAAAALVSETNLATSEANAATSEANALTSETNAATSETNAATSETNAAASELAAATSESNAATSESNAATSASNAATSASEANTSELNAAASETAAANHLTAIETIYDNFDDRYLGAFATDPTVDNDGNPLIIGAMYFNTTVDNTRFYNGSSWEDPEYTATTAAVSASDSADAAAISEANAADSEAAAATSEANAATSESNAATSASNAATSESNAAASASDAATSESNAATSESNAASSASDAATSASNAATSETNAADSASAAATSETNAANSATSASNSASAASSSETNASTYASNALASQTAAEAAYDSFDDRYLGAKASAPTTDNDGEALIIGALYWNTTNNFLYIWDGSSWNVGTFDTSAGVLSFNTRVGAVTLTNADITGATGQALDITGTPSFASVQLTGGTGDQGTITDIKVGQWDEAYGWGDHSTEGYLTSFTETDPVFTAWDKSTGISITESQISDLGSYVTTNSVQALHSTDALSLTANTLYINKADGTNESVDLSLYLDDTNLARIISGTYVVDEPLAGDKNLKFVRDDASVFYIDASMFFDDTNLVTSVNGEAGAVTLDYSDVGADPAGTINYTHPTYAGDDFSVDTGALTGATVVSDIDINVTTDTLGHVTDANGVVSTRTLTLADLGYTGETNATADQTAAEILTAIKTVDGSGSGLDADTLDGSHASSFMTTSHPANNITSTHLYMANGDGFVWNDTTNVMSVRKDGTDYVNIDAGNISSYANNYTHPSYAGDDINLDTGALSGATVISDLDFNVTTDTLGHVTDANATYATRNITYSDVGAAPSSHTHSYLPLSGGTLTGDLTINKTGSAGITINADTDNVTETDLPFLKFTQDGGIGQLTVGVDNNKPYIYPNRTDNATQSADVNQLWLKYKDGSFQQMFHDGYHPNADKWTTARTLSLSGDASGSVSWDGSANATLSVTVNDDSHNHTIANVDGLQTALDGKAAASHTHNYLPLSGGTLTGSLTVSQGSDINLQAGSNEDIGDIVFRYYDGSEKHRIWDAGTYLAYRYLGGTAQKIWHQGNDGSGSGLDADTLDGSHASAFAAASHTHSYNPTIGTDTDINTSGSTIIDNIYVTDGVITSMGTRTLTAADLGITVPSTSYNAVGSYCMVFQERSSDFTPGATIAGSSLRPYGVRSSVSKGGLYGGGYYGTVLSGTWRIMGFVDYDSSTKYLGTIAVRIS